MASGAAAREEWAVKYAAATDTVHCGQQGRWYAMGPYSLVAHLWSCVAEEEV